MANVANYPFCTIEPNVGIVEVPDSRLPVLANVIAGDPSTSLRMNKPPIIPAVVQFYDIAGLVRGASKGEGLGNKFLSHIREVAAIVHVVRLFEDGDVIHVSNKISPKDDIEIIESELMLADLETLSKQREPNQTATKEQILTWQVGRRVMAKLNSGVPVRGHGLTSEEKQMMNHLNLLTLKPVIYLFNLSEKQLEEKEETEKKIKETLESVRTGQCPVPTFLYLSAKLETDVLAFSQKEQQEYLQQFGLNETGLNRLIKKAYETLGLISFLTAGVKEVRAWTIVKGMMAPQAAGTIHSDFEKHFIKADVIPFQKFVDAGGWVKAREKGLVVSAGKDYEMKEGEVVEFKVGI